MPLVNNIRLKANVITACVALKWASEREKEIWIEIQWSIRQQIVGKTIGSNVVAMIKKRERRWKLQLVSSFYDVLFYGLGFLGRKRFANKSQFYQCFIFTGSHYLENVFCMCGGSLSPFFSILARLKMNPFIELDIFTWALATYSFFRLCSIPFDKIQFCFVSSNSEILAQSSQCKIFRKPHTRNEVQHVRIPHMLTKPHTKTNCLNIDAAKCRIKRKMWK